MSSVSAEGKQTPQEEELASAKRVRNKISIAHDSSLSKILSLLLPRLLRKLDVNFKEILNAHISTVGHTSEANSSTQIEHDERVSTRNHIHNEYRCIIDHAIDRISDGEFDVIPIIETISEYVLGLYHQSSTATISSRRSSPGETYALRIQRECMTKLVTRRQDCTNDNDTEMKRRTNALYSILKSGSVAVEDMHKNDGDIVHNVQRQNYRGMQVAQDKTWKDKHIVAGWLVLDSIALLLDIRPISIDQQSSEEVATKKKKETAPIDFLQHPHYQPIVDLVSPLASSGVYNLFLDLIISQHYSSGMSTKGLARLRAPAVSEMTYPPSTSDWNLLRLAVLQIAVGNGKGEGIFGNYNGHSKEGIGEGVAKAVTLLVLTTSGRGLSRELNSINLTRFAGSLLDTYLDKGDRNQLPSMMLQSKKKKSRKDVSTSVIEDERNTLIVQASSLLLCLALGGAEAKVVLQKHEEDRMYDSSSQLMVDDVASDRSPLSSRMTSAILHFVTEQLQKNKVSSQLNKDTILFFNLSFCAAQSALKITNSSDDLIMTHRLQVGWGDRVEGAAARGAALMESLSTCLCHGSSRIEELDTLLGQMLDESIDFLRTEVLNNIGVDANTQLLDAEEDLDMGEEVEDERIRAIRQRRIEQARDFQARLLRERREKLVPPIEIRIAMIKVIQNIMSGYLIPTTNDDSLFDIPILLFNCLAVDRELSAHIAIALEKLVVIYQKSIKKDKVSKDVGEFAAAPLLPPLLSSSTSESSASKRLAISWATQVIGYLDQGAACAICSFLLNDPNDAVTVKAAKQYITSVKPIANNEQKNEQGCSSAVMFFDSSNDLDMEIMSAKLTTEDLSVVPEDRCSDMDVDATSKGLCEICFDDDLADEQLYSFKNCKEHNFCRDCFTNYIAVKLEERNTAIDCPQMGCKKYMIESDAEELLNFDQLTNWKHQLLESRITKSTSCRRCVGVDCTMIAYQEGDEMKATCTKCQASFCFGCGEENHVPAKCSDIKAFLPLLSSSELAVRKLSKPCPGCKAPIEKNDGCNHMTCKCGVHWCWLCAQKIEGYADLERHVCNRYNPSIGEFKPEERNAFYLLRYEACRDSEEFAKTHLESLIKDFKSEDAVYDLDKEDYDILVNAAECLVSGRHFLKHTYVVAWAFPADDERKDLFEKHQAILAVFTEKLSSLVETKLESLGGERAFNMHLRALQCHETALKLYSDRMNDFLANSTKP